MTEYEKDLCAKLCDKWGFDVSTSIKLEHLSKELSSWEISSIRNFDKDELALISKVEIRSVQYDYFICLTLTEGRMVFIQLGQHFGGTVDMNKALLVTLTKDGDNIYRVLI